MPHINNTNTEGIILGEMLVTKRQTLMQYPRRCLYEVPGIIKFIDSKMLVAKGSGKGEGELFGECRALVLQDGKDFWGLVAGQCECA